MTNAETAATITAKPTLFSLPVGSVLRNPSAFRVIERKTADDYDADGLHNIARLMRDQGRVASLLAQRGNGHKLHILREYTDRRTGATVYSYEQAI